MNALCIVVIVAYGLVIAKTVIVARKDKNELKELDERLEGYLKSSKINTQ